LTGGWDLNSLLAFTDLCGKLLIKISKTDIYNKLKHDRYYNQKFFAFSDSKWERIYYKNIKVRSLYNMNDYFRIDEFYKEVFDRDRYIKQHFFHLLSKRKKNMKKIYKKLLKANQDRRL
jgi:hypothetical protein